MNEEIKIKISVMDTDAIKKLEGLKSTLTGLGRTVDNKVQNISQPFQKLGKVNEKVVERVTKTGSVIRRITTTFGDMGKTINKANVNLDDANEVIAAMGGAIQKPAEQVPRFANAMKEANLPLREWNNYARDNNLVLTKSGAIVDGVSGQVFSYGQAIRKATIKMRRFKMEWLSILFAGMALDRAFGGLLKTQLQLFGVTDTLAAAWTVVLLPIMQLITPLIYKLIEAFMDMPYGAKIFVGAFVIIAAIIGKVMVFLGQFFLAFKGIMMLFPAFGAKITAAGGLLKALGAVFTGLSATVAIVIAAIIAVFVGMYMAWKENILGMKTVIKNFIGGFKDIFNGLISFFKGLWMIIRGIFTGNGDLIVEGFIKIFKGLGKVLVGLFKVVGNAIAAILIGAVTIVLKVIQGLVNVVLAAYDKIAKLLGKKGTKFRVDFTSFLKGSFQTGGTVPETGPYLLHKGEEVIRRSEVGTNNTNFAPNITVNMSGGSSTDGETIARRISEQLNREWSYKFSRMKGR